MKVDLSKFRTMKACTIKDLRKQYSLISKASKQIKKEEVKEEAKNLKKNILSPKDHQPNKEKLKS